MARPAGMTGDNGRSALRASIGHLSALLRLNGVRRSVTPLLTVLGLVASLAEALGITLVVLFVYSVVGELEAIAETSGPFGRVLGVLHSRLDNPMETAALIAALILLRGLLSFAHVMVSAKVGEGISKTTRDTIHQRYLTFDYPYFRRFEQAQLMEVLGSESWQIAGAHANLTRISINICSILIFGAILVFISWQIALMAALGSTLLSWGIRRLSEPARALGLRTKRLHQELGEHMLVTLQGMRTIRAYGQEGSHHARFTTASEAARRVSLSLTFLSALLTPLTEVGYLLIMIMILLASFTLELGTPVLIAAIALLYRLQPHMRELEGCLINLAQLEPQLRSVRAMVENDHGPIVRGDGMAKQDVEQAIVFDRVSLSYDGGDLALDEVSFDIPAGKTTALIGPSGAGKSTIVNLLLRLYTPVSGQIRVDGAPLDTVRREDWLAMLAVAGQDIDLIEGTVLDNIRMAKADATDAEVTTAMRLAGIGDMIESLPEGTQTWIGQEGTRFSGGQRQRLGLARAILRDPRVLILDEAMSALDRELEDHIRAMIDAHFVGRTVIIITHRTETVATADHVVRIEKGRVVDSGPAQRILAVAGQRASGPDAR